MVMPAGPMLAAVAVLGLLLSAPASAERTTVQEVPCAPGPEVMLARDGTVSACRIAAETNLQVGPTAGNGTVACAAGSSIEFHRNGYLAFCGSVTKAGTYVTRSRAPTQCRNGSRVAFDENGYLEYCSQAVRAPTE
jgi:hypothetical protein